MRCSWQVCVCFAVFLAFPLTASADPIQFYVGGYLYDNKVDNTVNLADLTQGAKLTFDVPLTSHAGDYSMPINSGASFFINSGTPLNSPAVDFFLNLQGLISHSASNPASNLDGGFTGTIANVFPDHDFTVANGVPPWLVDLVAHPERIHVSGVVTGGVQNLLETTLTIDPPTVVPEPSPLSILLVACLGLMLNSSIRNARSKAKSGSA